MEIFLYVVYTYLAGGVLMNFIGPVARKVPWELMKIVANEDAEPPRWKMVVLEIIIRTGILLLYPYFTYDLLKKENDEATLYKNLLK